MLWQAGVVEQRLLRVARDHLKVMTFLVVVGLVPPPHTVYGVTVAGKSEFHSYKWRGVPIS